MTRKLSDDVIENRRKIDDIGSFSVDSISTSDTETIDYTKESSYITTVTSSVISVDGSENQTLNNKIVTNIGKTIIVDILDINTSYNSSLDRIELGYDQQDSRRSAQSLADSQHTIDVDVTDNSSTISIEGSVTLEKETINKITEIGLYDANDNLIQYRYVSFNLDTESE